MLGELQKGETRFPIIDFTAPDTLILRGTFVEFETSLKKSHKNGYVLQGCDDKALLKAWEAILQGKVE